MKTYIEHLKEVKHDGLLLQFVPKRFWTDELLFAALHSEGMALRYIPEHRITWAMCMIAVRRTKIATQFVPDDLRTEEIYEAARRGRFNLRDGK